MTPKFHSLRISAIHQETDDTISVTFDVPTTLSPDYSFLPGQYLTLKSIIEGEEVRRSYSLCAAPYEGLARVAIKRVEGGKFSTYATQQLKVGDALDVMTPMGNFTLQTVENARKSYVLFAVGSGITPILSIIKSILKEEENSDVTLFYGNKHVGSIIFREEIEGLKNSYMSRLRVVHVLSQENLGNKIQKGRITKDKCSQLYDAFLSNTRIDGVYICGPEEMILGTKESLQEKGVDEKIIHFELFTASSQQKKEVVQSTDNTSSIANVSIVLDGDSFDIAMYSSGETVLDAAQRTGLDLPFACKGGVCCTCRAKIIEGSARMTVNYSLEQADIDAGFILTCQAHPTSERLIVSFDE